MEGNCQSEVLGPDLDLHVPSVPSASQATLILSASQVFGAWYMQSSLYYKEHFSGVLPKVHSRHRVLLTLPRVRTLRVVGTPVR